MKKVKQISPSVCISVPRSSDDNMKLQFSKTLKMHLYLQVITLFCGQHENKTLIRQPSKQGGSSVMASLAVPPDRNQEEETPSPLESTDFL